MIWGYVMGFRNPGIPAGETSRVVFNLNGVDTNYAPERLTLGAAGPGLYPRGFMGVTALVESLVTGATIELWLPRVANDPNLPASSFGDADYFNSGLTPLTTAGAANWSLAGWPGAQIRVKSSTTAGAMSVSASAF